MKAASERGVLVVFWFPFICLELFEPGSVSGAVIHSVKFRHDNGYDHRAGAIDLNIEKYSQFRRRVHRIDIPYW